MQVSSASCKSTSPDTLSNENVSPKMRRRSSTGDMNKFARTREFDNTSVTTVDEQDGDESEDAVSISSSELLEEEMTPAVLQTKDSHTNAAAVELRSTTNFVAEKGNRLSQLEIADSNPDNKIESVVEIEYDL